jgi:hypothetical protein
MSEELISCNQPIRQSTEKQSLVTLIGLGALLLIIGAVYLWGTSSQPPLFGTLLAIDFRDSFCFCGLVDVPAQEISSKHSLDHSDWRCALSIDPCATRSAPALNRY